MSKHTPGPWEASRWNVVCGGTHIAAATALRIGVDQAHANARLIAAAPDLYALADWIATAYESTAISHVDFRVQAYQLALDALAKARGE